MAKSSELFTVSLTCVWCRDSTIEHLIAQGPSMAKGVASLKALAKKAHWLPVVVGGIEIGCICPNCLDTQFPELESMHTDADTIK